MYSLPPGVRVGFVIQLSGIPCGLGNPGLRFRLLREAPRSVSGHRRPPPQPGEAKSARRQAEAGDLMPLPGAACAPDGMDLLDDVLFG
jgi:hypothetical protein